MNPKFTQIDVWPISRELFRLIVEDDGLGAKNVKTFHEMCVAECERRGIEVPKPPKPKSKS